MSNRVYRCIGICLGNPGDLIGPRALCRVAEDIENHATCTNTSFVAKKHRVLTSDVVKVEVTDEKISVFTQSGSEYWMPNDEGCLPIDIVDKRFITDFLARREYLPRMVDLT